MVVGCGEPEPKPHPAAQASSPVVAKKVQAPAKVDQLTTLQRQLECSKTGIDFYCKPLGNDGKPVLTVKAAKGEDAPESDAKKEQDVEEATEELAFDHSEIFPPNKKDLTIVPRHLWANRFKIDKEKLEGFRHGRFKGARIDYTDAVVSPIGDMIDKRLRVILKFFFGVRYYSEIFWHYIISPDGVIRKGREEQYSSESNSEADVEKLRGTITVCFMGNYNKEGQELTDAAKESLVVLLADRFWAYDIEPGNVELFKQLGWDSSTFKKWWFAEGWNRFNERLKKNHKKYNWMKVKQRRLKKEKEEQAEQNQ